MLTEEPGRAVSRMAEHTDGGGRCRTLRWNPDMHVSMSVIEGLQLHTMGLEDGDAVRTWRHEWVDALNDLVGARTQVRCSRRDGS